MKDIRELSNQEIDQVSGGVAPLFFLGVVILTGSMTGTRKE